MKGQRAPVHFRLSQWGLPVAAFDLMEQHLVRRMALKQKRREERSRRLDGSTE